MPSSAFTHGTISFFKVWKDGHYSNSIVNWENEGVIYIYNILFIYWTERERSQVGKEAGREREKKGSKPPAEQRVLCGA